MKKVINDEMKHAYQVTQIQNKIKIMPNGYFHRAPHCFISYNKEKKENFIEGVWTPTDRYQAIRFEVRIGDTFTEEDLQTLKDRLLQCKVRYEEMVKHQQELNVEKRKLSFDWRGKLKLAF